VSKQIRISKDAYLHLEMIKAQHYNNPRFSLGDALDKLIEENQKQKDKIDFLMGINN
jgi:predicted CopG family antitoxin